MLWKITDISDIMTKLYVSLITVKFQGVISYKNFTAFLRNSLTSDWFANCILPTG